MPKLGSNRIAGTSFRMVHRSVFRHTALLAVSLLVSCAGVGDPSPDRTTTAFRARGNEPGWRLDIDGGTMTLVTQSGRRVAAPTPTAQRTGDATRYLARADGGDFTVTIREQLCRDTMTGMPHPNAVEVVLDGRTLAGCGGEPASLLQGREWVVEDIDGKGIVDSSRPTLNFGGDGRVAGHASCNSYTAQYRLSGETLTIAQAVGTMMACPAALMAQEALFLDVLRNVRRFDFAPDGALLLRSDDRGTITARR